MWAVCLCLPRKRCACVCALLPHSLSLSFGDSQLLCALKFIRFCLHQFHAGAVDVNMLLLLRMDVDIFGRFLVFRGSPPPLPENCCCLWNDLCRHSPATSASVEGQGAFIAGRWKGEGVPIFNSNNHLIHPNATGPRFA